VSGASFLKGLPKGERGHLFKLACQRSSHPCGLITYGIPIGQSDKQPDYQQARKVSEREMTHAKQTVEGDAVSLGLPGDLHRPGPEGRYG
jgi:hypothetical protein